MTALLDDIGTALTAAGVISSGWAMAKSFTPPTPDQMVVVNETGGHSDPDQTSITAHTYPSFQVKVRGKAFEYDIARAKLQDVFDALNDATVSGYTFVFPTSDAIAMPMDDNDRPSVVQNFNAMKVI